jgi:DNA-binding LytR/AlgR family response regulator
MNCIIVDDDQISRDAIKHFVSQVQFLNLVKVCTTGTEALNILNSDKIDLVFLDIEMPDITGLELLKTLNNPPLIIFTTSQKEYAIEAFEFNVVDYLLKPISLDRFFKATARAKEIFENSPTTIDLLNKKYVFVKNNGVLVKIDINEILWIEALGDYMTINTSGKKYTIHSTMKMIERKLDPNKFIRIHRSSIISIDNITSIEDNIVVIGKQLIPVGAVYKENLTKRLNLL